MNAEIIGVGTELLLGQIVNSDAQYLSRELSVLGVNVFYHSVVGDNPQRLKNTLKTAIERSDMVITTGGLGPTKDDLTKEIIAEAFQLELKLHEESCQRLKEFFVKINKDMCSNNMKQAYLPEGSIPLTNNYGTAPGCIVEKKGKIVVMLPGPPRELKPMFDDYVKPYILSKKNEVIFSKVLRFFDIGESTLDAQLGDLIENQTNPTIAPYAQTGEVILRVTAKASTQEKAQDIIKPIVEEIYRRLGEFIYTEEYSSLNETVAKMLINNNITISTAESCTGGLLAGSLTEIAGISSIYKQGFITYSNDSKNELLGVNKATLDTFGAVSSETAIEMAQGLLKRTKCDIAVSVTGIAGPGGGTEEKPVGLVYVGVATKDKSWAEELRNHGDRERIRHVTVLRALNIVRKYIIEKYGK